MSESTRSPAAESAAAPPRGGESVGLFPTRGWLIAGLLVALGADALVGDGSLADTWQLPLAGAVAVLFVVVIAWGIGRIIEGLGSAGRGDNGGAGS